MSADFASAFEEVATFLRSKGVTPSIESGRRATQVDLDRFKETTGVELPSSFSDFFTAFADGYRFSWESGDESGCFSMPNLELLAEMRCQWARRTMEFTDDLQSLDQCIEAEFRDRAFEIWTRMSHWSPFIEEMDGDHFCVDLSGGEVVFDKHDWFDGFGEVAETNGMLAGSSLIDFIHHWGRFCFSPMWFTDAPHPAEQTHLEWLTSDSEFER